MLARPDTEGYAVGGSGPAGSAGTQGFLFCDLRGYAAYVDAHGDQAAAELLATYRALVRGVIADHEGAEIRTEGDSVYVVFPTASSAVEAGLAIVAGAAASTRERPLRVGVGVHAGETVASDEGPVGGAVNIAARVCAKAQAGEVLVTDTVRALTRTLLPYRFVGLGTQKLKGIGGVALYRVEATSAGRLAHLRRRLSARRRLVAGVALLAAVVLVGGSAAWVASRPVPCLALGPTTKDVVARIDPARGCVVATYPVGRRPGLIAASGSTVWVANTDSRTISVIDTSTETQQFAGLPGRPIGISLAQDGNLTALTFADKSESWTGSAKSLVVISSTDATVLTTYELPILQPNLELAANTTRSFPLSGFMTVTAWAGGFLLPNDKTGDIMRVSFDGMLLSRGPVIRLKDPIPPTTPDAGAGAHSGIESLAAAGGVAWIGDATDPSLYRYSGGTAADRVPLDGTAGTKAVAATASTIWLLRTDGSLTALDPVTRTLTSHAVGRSVTTLAASTESVWVGDPGAATVRRIDPATGATLVTVPTGGQPKGLAIAADGSVWVTVAAP